MLKRRTFENKAIAAICSVIISVCALTGCGNAAFEEYLKDIGIMNPDDYYDEADVAGSTEPVVIMQDLPVSSQYMPIYGVEEETDVTQEAPAGMSDGAMVEEEEADPQDYSGADSLFISNYKQLSDEGTDEGLKAARQAVSLTKENIEAEKKKQKGLYAFERLTDSGKTLYVELLLILQNLGKDILVSTTSDEAIELVYDYLMADHPEFFYVDGYQYTNYILDGVITKITFTGNYLYDKDEIKRRQELINDAVNTCLAGAPSSTDDYYAIKYVYDYLIKNTDYNMDAADNQNICSVFINGESVCNGYSKAAQYLLNKLGIPCTLVTGTVSTKNSSGVRHAWNLVLCNNAYYYMDVTWGDASYQTSAGESADATKFPSINYDYLNVTTQEIRRNHQISSDMSMPNCTSMKDNYYVREDEYFTYAEPALVRELFERRYDDGSDNVTIKCASDAVYNALFEMLISDRGVFDYFHDETNLVSYTTFADTRTLIFWLR